MGAGYTPGGNYIGIDLETGLSTGLSPDLSPVGYGAGTNLPGATDESKAQFLETALNVGLALAYGRHLVGGTPVLSDYDSAAKITKLFIANGEGKWHALEKLWIDSLLRDETDTTLVHFHPGLDGAAGTETVPGTPNQKICSLFPATLTGTTFARTVYTALAIPDDPMSPGTSFAVQGIYQTREVRIFDVAGNQTDFAYSANPAWCALDAFITLYLKPHGAVNESLTTAEKARIDFGAFKAAADYCDADIGGGTARFEAHIFFKENTTLSKIFETICATCRGYMRESQGKLGLYIDQPRSSVFTFDADNIVDGSFKTSSKDLRTTVNRLVVKIRDLKSGGADAAKDFAPFIKPLDAEWHQEQVGRTIKQEIDLGANTKERIERVGTYWLNRGLLARQAQLSATQDAGAVMPGDRVGAPVDQAMVDVGYWEVLEITDEPNGSRQVSLQEYDASIFSDAAGAQQAVEDSVPAGGLLWDIYTGGLRGYGALQALYAIQDANGNVYNPLSAVTAGTTSKIDIQPFYLWYKGVAIAVLSAPAQISNLTPGITYHVYYNDPTLAGGNVTVLATANSSLVENAYGQIKVGTITTPLSTGGGVTYRPTSYGEYGSSLTYNPELAFDGNGTTSAEGHAYKDGDGSYVTGIIYFGPSNPSQTKSNVSMKLDTSLWAQNGKGGDVYYSLDGGANWIVVFDQDTSRAYTEDTIALADAQDWSLLRWKVDTRCPASTGEGGVLNIYDIRIEGTLT